MWSEVRRGVLLVNLNSIHLTHLPSVLLGVYDYGGLKIENLSCKTKNVENRSLLQILAKSTNNTKSLSF